MTQNISDLVKNNQISVSDLIASLDLSKAEPMHDLDRLDDELETGHSFTYDDTGGDRIKRVTIHEWICTDTPVGLYGYFFDGKPVAISTQPARRADTEWHWVSEEAALAVREFVRSLHEFDWQNPPLVIGAADVIESHWLEQGPYNDRAWRQRNGI